VSRKARAVWHGTPPHRWSLRKLRRDSSHPGRDESQLTVMEWLPHKQYLNVEKEKAAEFEPDGSKWSLAGGAKPCISTKPAHHSVIFGSDM